MRDLETRIKEVKDKIDKKLNLGQNDERLNSKYKELLKQKYNEKQTN